MSHAGPASAYVDRQLAPPPTRGLLLDGWSGSQLIGLQVAALVAERAREDACQRCSDSSDREASSRPNGQALVGCRMPKKGHAHC